ncbi:Methyltransferase domain [Streptoalloteichus tenebrarius]|uniref:Methyltransferase domain n=1 Tax=Streptoalloteichus tenebrarius (strain ATCC 17920 / DSM 40477 / JCM 4838 / CBS 697.72 / NBRC 16177 / NCIMB 11028 / NRRL B-12390 / A12253. 1 / ISP 5477) TaxID=1933 RepID=A0ABT1HLL2_STRSD|nr:class I SAM-dependent methyltransferase [Streptoalloteichus tenebrarius]MCP2256380.1 Methyltransferase domain [Streptoalloteichus tenebrarius]BFF04725.1 class I SAM-dependent methyltransferase [Streptoalloteichus tenebrarius]
MVADPQDSTTASLLRAAGTPDALGNLIDDITLSGAATLIVEELVSRCAPPKGVSLALLFEVYRGDESVEHTISFADGAIDVTPGRHGEPGALIRFEVVDLLTALYGPASRPSRTTRQVESLLRPPGRDPREDSYLMFKAQVPYAEAIQSVLACFSPEPANLDDLAVRYGSDKWGFLHWFTPHYAQHFRHLADEPVKVLEIGIGGYDDPNAGGASLRMWQRYFRRGLVYGLDIHDKSAIRGPRLRTIRGDQGDADFLRELAESIGPFDIVIDDGSHINEHVLTSFDALFPYVREGGLYVIEDMHTSYWPGFGGAAPGEGTARTSVERVKELLDGLNFPEYRDMREHAPSITEKYVSGVHCYRNIAFIEKGLNAKDVSPEWVPREPV